MLEIHARDYFSLKYDAAAQNRISSVTGKNYTRNLTEESKTIKVTNVTLSATNEQVALPFKIAPVSYRSYDSYAGVYDQTNSAGYRILSTTRFEDLYKPLTFRQGLASAMYSGQHVLFAKFEVIFRDLNLPEGVTPEVALLFNTQHFARGFYSREDASKKDYDLDQLMIPYLTPEHIQEGTYITHNWERIWLGACIKETDARDVEIAQTSGYDAEIPKALYDYCYWVPAGEDGSEIHAGVGEYRSYTSVSTGPVKVQFAFENTELTVDDFDRVVRTDRLVTVEQLEQNSYLRGTYLDSVTMETQLVDRDTFRVAGEIPILIDRLSFMRKWEVNSYFAESYPLYANIYEWLKSLEVQITYTQMSWAGTDFAVQLEGEKDLYPYKFANTRMGNIEDTVRGHNWNDYYPKLLLDKYGEGKHYVELKMRAAFMLDNNVGIGTSVQIYDLKNRAISRNGVPCTFKVKRIIKSFSNNEFYYIINCLEE